MELDFIAQPQAAARLGDFLKRFLSSSEWLEFRAAVAFVKRSGTKHIRDELAAFSGGGGRVKISAGIDAGGTSAEGLLDLLNAVGNRGEIFVFKNANSSTFHPKVYLFKNNVAAAVLVGSGNLTEGGLFTNYEAAFLLRLDLRLVEHSTILATIEQALDGWSTSSEGICYVLTEAFVQKLLQAGHLPDEAHTRTIDEKKSSTHPQTGSAPLFKWLSVPPAPKIAKSLPEEDSEDETQSEDEEAKGLVVVTPPRVPAQDGANRIFLMTLQKTDVGVGQTTAGTSRRSPEIFIPLICRDNDPQFWAWPTAFVPDANWTGPIDGDGRGKMDRANVMVRLGGDTFPVVMWYNPQKRDLRIRSEHMRSAGNIGDILYVERSDGANGFAYYVEVIPQNSARYADYLAYCSNDVRNSKKKWGYL